MPQTVECLNCGSSIASTDIFCPECGHRQTGSTGDPTTGHDQPQTAAPASPPPLQPQYPPQPNTNGKAVASMVTGIVSLVVPFVGIVTGPLAIVLAARARTEIRQTSQKGDGLAITGLVTGILGCIGYGIFLLIIIIGALAGAGSASPL
ncbi:DUF4190 domain-containing protein [Streptomyces sviceus]|uniref:DUF4190 domain-containing protein n=1 Tax=Streptomyces sviceus TaxID=285530 RepID=UPI00367CE7B7